MTEELPPEPKRFQFEKKVDTEWKRKMQLEKERLAKGLSPEAPAAKPAAPPAKGEAPAPPPQPAAGGKAQPMDMAFVAILQQLADQAALFMGLVPGYGEKNCEQALAAIEMLRALQEKTQGNLVAEESKALTGILYELQMRYVQSCGGGGAA